MNILHAIENLRLKTDLASDEMENIFAQIFSDSCHEDEVREFLVQLSHKGETEDEIFGAVHYLRKQGVPLHCKSTDLIDCCGTGGDGQGTFNFSTAVAFVLAGAGCKVAKHGNRAMSSKSGSADVLLELGVKIDATSEMTAQHIDEIGIGFLFAPNYYPLLKKVADIRRSIPHRTIFNVLGPLLNPAHAKKQLIGVYDKKLTHTVASVLQKLGSESVVVLHAEDGMDEISLTGPCFVSQLKDGKITDFIFDPRESGYPYCKPEDLKGGTPKENAERLKKCLKGHSEPLDHVVHINAAWGFIAAGKVTNFMDGLLLAQESISSGRAYEKLEVLISKTNSSR